MATAAAPPVRIKRIYEPSRRGDGLRVLVDRLWPRGVSKAAAEVDVWAKQLAPSSALRTWFGHDPSRFDEFARRYTAELDAKSELIDELLNSAGRCTTTLLYAARDSVHNHAVVLRAAIVDRATKRQTGKAKRQRTPAPVSGARR